MIQQRLCNNCRHFRNDLFNFQKCSLRRTHVEHKIDLVNGQLVKPKLEYASILRLPAEDCGIEGKLYEFEMDPIKRSLNANGTYYAAVYAAVPSIIVLLVYIIIIIWKKQH